MGLGRRILVLAVLFAIELALISLAFDGAALRGRTGLAVGLLARWGPGILRLVVGSLAILATFAYLGRKKQLGRLDERLARAPLSPWLLGPHLAALGLFAWIGRALYSSSPLPAPENIVTAVFLIAAVAAMFLGAIAIMPLRLWIGVARTLGVLWVYSIGAAALAGLLTNASQALWRPTSEITFQLVKAILRPFTGPLIVDPRILRIATPRFGVLISPECSGLEGIGLLILFGVLWLWLFRKECRFPQAFALIPAAIVILFLLNSVRIAALILIGDAGARQIAIGGFHSQAGWISFNAVAFGFCVAARRTPWITLGAARDAKPARETNPVAPFLMPFLAILAAGMLSRSLTGHFEWLYPLRVVAAAAAIWTYRRDYAKLDWRAGWIGPAAGVLVFVVWVGLDRAFGQSATASMPPDLRAASDPARALWIGLRVLSAVIAAPLAEELAFRGFLIRRFASADFESLPLARFTWVGLLGSSILFGALHGGRWVAGTLAGLIYGLVMIRNGRVGDAVVAHAVTNALLVAAVLIFGAWQYW